jgi:hypothetical protein
MVIYRLNKVILKTPLQTNSKISNVPVHILNKAFNVFGPNL